MHTNTVAAAVAATLFSLVVLASEGDDLAVAVGGLSVLASGLMDHSEAIVAVVHIGEPHQEVAGGLLGFVEPSGVNEFAHGVGGGGQCVVIGFTQCRRAWRRLRLSSRRIER